MKEAASVFLRADIKMQDGRNLARWMNDQQITEYLNEKENISEEITSLLNRSLPDMLTFHFNQRGRFFMICVGEERSVGFVNLVRRSSGSCEIVYAIGEKQLWGRGYGERALDLALGKAFCEMRMEYASAHIMKDNLRSIRAAARCGMRFIEQKGDLLIYNISAAEHAHISAVSRESRRFGT